MKFLYKLINLFSLSFFCTCSSSYGYSEYAYKIINDHSKEFKRKMGWDLEATGGGWTTDIRTIRICYLCYQEVDYAGARQLYVSSLNRLLQLMNTDLKIRPYLRDFPSTWKNVELRLAFVDPSTKKDVRKGKVAMVQNMDGILYYWVFDEAKNGTVVKFKEPYEEAMRLVCQQNLQKLNLNINQNNTHEK